MPLPGRRESAHRGGARMENPCGFVKFVGGRNRTHAEIARAREQNFKLLNCPSGMPLHPEDWSEEEKQIRLVSDSFLRFSIV